MTPKNFCQFRGRFVRDPHLTTRRDGSGDRVVLGRIVVRESYADAHGEPAARETYIDVHVFNRAVAARLVEHGVARGTEVALAGFVTLARDVGVDKTTGEERTYTNIRLTVDDTEGHSGDVVGRPRAVEGPDAPSADQHAA